MDIGGNYRKVAYPKRLIKRILRKWVLYGTSENSMRKIMGVIKDNETKGDYLEFGVYKGNSMNYAMQMAEEMKIIGMKFYGFDSFQGFPEHREGGWQLTKGNYQYPKKDVEKFLNKKGYKYEFKLIEGFFSNVEIPEEVKEVAIVNIDCDLYDSTKRALEMIRLFLKKGMIIRFDDWFLFFGDDNFGERKAFSEFKEEVKDFEFREHYNDGSGISFIVGEKNGK